MYVKRNIRWGLILRFAWGYLLFYLIWSSSIVVADYLLEKKGIHIGVPFLPISMIGIAVAFYIGFKNNQSYDRFWEARKIWGGIVNYSRTWANQVINFVTKQYAKYDATEKELSEIHKKLIYRHLAWINALRLTLRQPNSFSLKHFGPVKSLQKDSLERQYWEKEISCFLDKEEYDRLIDFHNVPTQLNLLQGNTLKELVAKGLVDDFRHMEMMRILEELYNLQGKCERIKNTPFPRQYAYFSKVFCWIFVVLLPFGLIGAFEALGERFVWLTVPFNIIISWIFMTMEVVGDNSEDPFENFVNDVPMTAICRTIEIDLKEMIREKNIPTVIKPECDILL